MQFLQRNLQYGDEIFIKSLNEDTILINTARAQ